MDQNKVTKELIKKYKLAVSSGLSNINACKAIFESCNNIDCKYLHQAFSEIVEIVLTAKCLGQFFTPQNVAHLMIKLTNPQNGDKVFDPASGLNSLLYTYLQYQNDPDNIYAQELEPDIFELGKLNLTKSTNMEFKNLFNGNTLKNPPNTKFDIILVNPPFGVKSNKYEDLNKIIFPIKTNNSTLLFLCLCIYLLKENGRCSFICPYSAELYNKNKSIVNIREYLLKTCNLKKIIILDKNTYLNTTIKSCILYFEKGVETSIVDFNGIMNISIDTIKNNNYSLFMDDYNQIQVIPNSENVLKIGNLFNVMKNTNHPGNIDSQGNIPFITCSSKITKFVDFVDFNIESIIIANKCGPIVHYLNKPFACANSVTVLQLKENMPILVEYVFVYLSKSNVLKKGYKGVTILHITQEFIKNIQIPILSIDDQKAQICKYRDDLVKVNELKNEISRLNIKIAEIYENL